jgi:hypothetical protein
MVNDFLSCGNHRKLADAGEAEVGNAGEQPAEE